MSGFGSDGFGGVAEDDQPGDNAALTGATTPASDPEGLLAEVELPEDPWTRVFGSPDPRVEAHAAGKAHAAYEDAGAGSYMNVVITFADAARVFAYRGLRAAAGAIMRFAERRVRPSR